MSWKIWKVKDWDLKEKQKEERRRMSNEGPPKLYTTKPKKSQLKSSPSPSKPMDPPPPPPSSTTTSSSGLHPHKESFARRYKFVWPVLLTVNFAIGVYLFFRTNKKESRVDDDEVAPHVNSTPTVKAPMPAPASAVERTTPVTASSVKVSEPIPEDKQRELFKWILEEKRKVKPRDHEEKKKLDEEKAILKQFIRGKSIPSL